MLKVVNYSIAFSISWLCGVIFTYFINLYWAFKPEEIISFKRRFSKYLMVYILSFVINLVLLYCGVELLDFNPFYCQFFLIPIIVCLNFIGIRYWVMK